MKKVITYGTYDLLHYGHIRLLERAKALGDYLIVGVTTNEFDRARGKINVRQSLEERIQNVRDLHIADEIIVEDHEGQKEEDIQKYGVDIFTVGSDWTGKFDYLKPLCEVVYLARTEGISSTDLRKEKVLRLGVIGHSTNVDKVIYESQFVHGLAVTKVKEDSESPESFFDGLDAVYIYSAAENHEAEIRAALEAGKHVLVETPVALNSAVVEELFALAKENRVVLMEALKTAFSTAYRRLIRILKSGKIGEIVSVDATCTSLTKDLTRETMGSLEDWGPTALLPVFDLLGSAYTKKQIVTKLLPGREYDLFTKIDFLYPSATASVKVGKGVKSEGELIVTGTRWYALVPSPWWKTESFEIRYENPAENETFFSAMEGEGIRYELVNFLTQCLRGGDHYGTSPEITKSIADMLDAYRQRDFVEI